MTAIGFLSKSQEEQKKNNDIENSPEAIHPAFSDIMDKYCPNENGNEPLNLTTDAVIEMLDAVVNYGCNQQKLFNKLKSLGYTINHIPGTNISLWVFYPVL